MNDKRQKNRPEQLELAFSEEAKGEASSAKGEGTEAITATGVPQSPVVTEKLMEGILRTSNLLEAIQRVRANKGSPGIDGMTVEEIQDYWRQNWPTLEGQLLAGTYQPQPVKRVEIPKPDGGVRKLGIPTVLCRPWRLGLPCDRPNRRVRTRTHGGVTGKAREGPPMSIASCQ